jgi:hypothetical protein
MSFSVKRFSLTTKKSKFLVSALSIKRSQESMRAFSQYTLVLSSSVSFSSFVIWLRISMNRLKVEFYLSKKFHLIWEVIFSIISRRKLTSLLLLLCS